MAIFSAQGGGAEVTNCNFTLNVTVVVCPNDDIGKTLAQLSNPTLMQRLASMLGRRPAIIDMRGSTGEVERIDDVDERW